MTTAVKHLYRTLLTLDGNHPTVRTAVLDVHYLHDLVMSPYRHRFPNGWNGARQAMEILYATQPQRDSTLKVMIQSGQAPNWAPPDPTILAAEIQQWAFTPDFRPGQIVPFRLRCNAPPPETTPHRRKTDNSSATPPPDSPGSATNSAESAPNSTTPPKPPTEPTCARNTNRYRPTNAEQSQPCSTSAPSYSPANSPSPTQTASPPASAPASAPEKPTAQDSSSPNAPNAHRRHNHEPHRSFSTAP